MREGSDAELVMREVDALVRLARRETIGRAHPTLTLDQLAPLLLAVKRYREGSRAKDPRLTARPVAAVHRKDGRRAI